MGGHISALEKSLQILKELDHEEKIKKLVKQDSENSIDENDTENTKDYSSENGLQKFVDVKHEEVKPVIEPTGQNYKLNLDEQNVLNGIILSEILGKPVSKRRGR